MNKAVGERLPNGTVDKGDRIKPKYPEDLPCGGEVGHIHEQKRKERDEIDEDKPACSASKIWESERK